MSLKKAADRDEFVDTNLIWTSYLTQEPLVKLCKALDLSLTAYSSFGPLGWYELDMGKGAQNLLQHDVVTKIATSSNKSELTFPYDLFPLDGLIPNLDT